MDKKKLGEIVAKIEKKNLFFKNKSFLDTLSHTQEIIGREKQVEELVSYLISYKQGSVVPLISVYGRSGSGKSTIVRFVCENLQGISYCFVNLRKAKTVFGSVNLILNELGQPSLKSAHGINVAVVKIEESTVSKLNEEGKNFLVMVLDEFDVLFYDKKERVSDFLYKLLVLEEHLKTKGLLMCIICISNNGLYYDLDDRVKSRIGSSEIFFEPYSKDDVVQILHKRAKKAFVRELDDSVLLYCAEISSLGHGDARRAVDLLRVAADIAAQNNERISKNHIDIASKELENDRVIKIVSSASFHFKIACMGLARITSLTDEDWHATSTIYRQYRRLLPKDWKPLTYRRVSELLVEIENTGLAVSHKVSKGRFGFGSQYKLTMLPAIIGFIIDKKKWMNIVENKKKHDEYVQSPIYKHTGSDPRALWDKAEHDKNWKEYVGL